MTLHNFLAQQIWWLDQVSKKLCYQALRPTHYLQFWRVITRGFPFNTVLGIFQRTDRDIEDEHCAKLPSMKEVRRLDIFQRSIISATDRSICSIVLAMQSVTYVALRGQL